MLEIRPAETADQKEIVQLWHQGWHDAHADLVPSEVLAFRTKDYFTLRLKDAQDTFLVATDVPVTAQMASALKLRPELEYRKLASDIIRSQDWKSLPQKSGRARDRAIGKLMLRALNDG
ncbi:hypothetical protein [Neorhizobium galegae]|uniref:hypothetical protein n=1 Tax=Neorhizobium galegae TaxID=399 RepID=UPI00127EE22C|nr:hypothetical protein [Neorhizobium galegae]KAA9382427.1 hypothetical protein F4V88_30605 [Neorhizobium galegae]KAB1108673.1 hypothetical protein F4V89_29075 [Neorhizobium galegae]MCM2497884.1 hypothetical protein [Neorhizobium galegae]MCQ1775452.1 hypothetical protein [Neorhizobium galegae]MCQ1799616.1 hypothetical protein [Neorhizobium galegae]